MTGSTRALPFLENGHFGRGISANLDAHLEQLDVARLIVIRCGESYQVCGAAQRVDDATARRTVRFLRASTPRTTSEQARAAINSVHRYRADAVLGVGGGNALDLAKLVASFADAPDEFDLCLVDPPGHRPDARRLRLLQVPTTAGSGSEATSFATVWQGPRKVSVEGPALRADTVLVDPGLARTTRPSTFAAAAIDALAQAIEAGWAQRRSQESARYASQSYAELASALESVINDGRDTDLDDRISWGATMAGAAINLARTTAAHALSYALTYRCGLPHGAAVGLCLPWVIRHNSTVASPPPSDADPARIIEALLSLGGFPTSLSQVDIDRAVLRADWADTLASDRARNNPRPLGSADLDDLLGTVGRETSPGAGQT